MNDEPWYRGGLRFACRPGCASCCIDHDEFSYVYLEGDDARRLADFLGLPEAEFRDRYVVTDDGNAALRSAGPACVFLDGTTCTVYDARPGQCRSFPFWPEALHSRRSWMRFAEFCPGIGDGPVHDADMIRSRCRASREECDADVP